MTKLNWQAVLTE